MLAGVLSLTTTSLTAGPAISCSSVGKLEPSTTVGCSSAGNEIWAVSGQIQDNGDLSGYFVWNPNTDAVVNLDIQLTGDSDYTDNPAWTFGNLISSGYTALEADNSTESLFLYFDSPYLPLGTSDPVGTQLTLSTASYVDGETDYLTSGNATVVPEPGSSVLALAGVLFLIAGTKMRRTLLSTPRN